jgi:hypothetical protein
VAKRPESPPVFPINVLRSGFSVIADLAALAVVFFADVPLLLKAVVAGALVLLPFGLLCYFVGRKRRFEAERYVAELEFENRQLRTEVGLTPLRATAQAPR